MMINDAAVFGTVKMSSLCSQLRVKYGSADSWHHTKIVGVVPE